MKKNIKSKIPKFKSYAEEADFWDTHSFTEFWDELEPVEGIEFDTDEGEDSVNDEIVYLRLPSETKSAVKRIASKRHRKMSDMLRLWVISKVKEDSYLSSGADLEAKTHSRKASRTT